MELLSNGNPSKRHMENGHRLKYMPRKVSAVRDFPPGCGSNAVLVVADKDSVNRVQKELEDSLDNLVVKVVAHAKSACDVEIELPKGLENNDVDVLKNTNEVKFELRRIPGQPKLAWKELKKSRKFKTREGLCVNDISRSKELFPICAVNTINDEEPPPFDYITKMIFHDQYLPVLPEGCNCSGVCTDSHRCSCAVKNGGEIPYNYYGAIVEAKSLVYECGPSCKCPSSCHNRVGQRGIKIQLEIFKTESRGWGVRSLNSISSGTFICEYIGELLEDKEAEQRTSNDEYLFDIGQNYDDCSLNVQSSSSEVVEDGGGGFTIDHSCTSNLYAQNVLYDNEDKRIPHIMFFAAENIPPLQELTYHYNYAVDQIRDSNGNIRMKNCYCGSTKCTGRMY